jgi:hypothetical protein
LPVIPGHYPDRAFARQPIAAEHQSNVVHAAIPSIRLELEAQFPAHFQHHGIFLKNLAGYAANALGFCVLDDQLHQAPAEPPALEIRSQQDRVFAGFAACVGMEPDDAEHLAAGFIDGDKGHRAQTVDICQSSDKLMREFLDGIEEAKPQIFLAHMCQKVANQDRVIRPDRPDKYPPAISKNKMPLPLQIGRSID